MRITVVTRAEILDQQIGLLAAQLRRTEEESLAILRRDIMGGMTSRVVVARYVQRLKTGEQLLAERLKRERALGLAPEDEATWHRELVASIHRIADQESTWVLAELEADARQARTSSTEAYIPEVRRMIEGLRNEALLAADIMKGEREHQKRVVPVPSTPSHNTLNISHSQIAGLNVGGVVGSIQANVNALQTAGQENLAEALKALTEAIAAETALTPEVRRESLELVSGIGEELERPADQQRPGVIRRLGHGLKEVLGQMGNLKTLYEMLKVAAKAGGYELP